jgi:hypothetical protein
MKNAPDYLLKLLSDERLENTLARAKACRHESGLRGFGCNVLRMISARWLPGR